MVDNTGDTVTVAIGTGMGTSYGNNGSWLSQTSLCAVSSSANPTVAQNETTAEVLVLNGTHRNDVWELTWLGISATDNIVVSVGLNGRGEENTGQKAQQYFETVHFADVAITDLVSN